jgi:hypothetical protein
MNTSYCNMTRKSHPWSPSTTVAPAGSTAQEPPPSTASGSHQTPSLSALPCPALPVDNTLLLKGQHLATPCLHSRFPPRAPSHQNFTLHSNPHCILPPPRTATAQLILLHNQQTPQLLCAESPAAPTQTSSLFRRIGLQHPPAVLDR